MPPSSLPSSGVSNTLTKGRDGNSTLNISERRNEAAQHSDINFVLAPRLKQD
jgi:hypothetical protein